MPAKPAWLGKIPDVIRDLQAIPRSFVDRATVEFLLGVGRRRAQQIMAPCVTDRVGANGLADRDLLVARLHQLANGEDGYYERRRRNRLSEILSGLREARLKRPPLLVEAPVAVLAQEFESLPAGVQLSPGRIVLDFDDPREALEKLLALAMAISNDFDQFERVVVSIDRAKTPKQNLSGGEK
jgi:hypothetical protein